MCETTIPLVVKTDMGWRPQAIDKCIAPLVKAMNDGGLVTLSACCGHNKELGHVWLENGSVLVILPDATKDDVIKAIARPSGLV